MMAVRFFIGKVYNDTSGSGSVRDKPGPSRQPQEPCHLIEATNPAEDLILLLKRGPWRTVHCSRAARHASRVIFATDNSPSLTHIEHCTPTIISVYMSATVIDYCSMLLARITSDITLDTTYD